MKHFNLLNNSRWLTTVILLTILGIGNTWGVDVVCKQTYFNSTNNSENKGSYSNSWYNTTSGFRVDITNANNNNNNWNYIKMGYKTAAITGTIITNDTIKQKVTKVSIYFGAVTSKYIDSVALYTSTDKSTWTYRGKYTIGTGWQDVSIAAAAQATNYYYKIAGVCKKVASSGTNGPLQIDSIKYYKAASAPSCSGDANMSESAASLKGSFSLSSVGVTVTGMSAGDNCTWSEAGFVWSPSSNTTPTVGGTNCEKETPILTSGTAATCDGTLTGDFSLGSTYYYRAYGKNNYGSATYQYSAVQNFTPRSVTFDLNGHGSSAPSTQYVNNGGKATDPEYSESVVGWEFDKWYKEAECTNAWTFGTDVVSGANKTLYAKWTNTYANTVYTLVEDLYELDNNKKIIIMNTGHSEALSTTQQEKNRTAVAYNASGNAGFAMSNSNKTATLASATSVQVITLKSTATTDVYQLNVENGYLRAAGSNTSYLLKTYGSTPDSYCNFLFSLSSGNFSVVGQGDNDNKNIKYNSSSHLFSGYGDTQNAILIYVEQSSSVATPTFSPAAGTYGSTQSVSLSCGTAGATIYYTTDGSEPTRSSTAYSSAISVSVNTTIKAKAFKRGMHASETASATYNIRCATPAFSPVAGTYSTTQNVSISCGTAGATIYYTTDGSEPTESSSEYSEAILVSANTTIKAIAVKSGMANSTIGSATFNIRCAQPTFSPAAGTKTGAQNITISAVTGATIYYTTDGSDPDENSSEYSSAIPISASTTIKAIAIKSGMANSEIASATYTIQYNITWMVNGETWTPGSGGGSGTNGSSLVNYGTAWSALTLPSDPDYGDYCGQAFVGWTTDNIGATGLDKDVPADATRIAGLNLMTSANQSGKSTTISGNTIFYAVFADYGEDGD